MKYYTSIGLLIIGSILGTIFLITGNFLVGVYAQNTTNFTSNDQGNWTGSIEINSVIRNAFDPLIQIPLSDAALSAEKHVGENASTIAAFIHPLKGYLVYMTYVLNGNDEITKVIVDAGNGQVLHTKQMSIDEFMNKFHPSSHSMKPSMYMQGHPGK